MTGEGSHLLANDKTFSAQRVVSSSRLSKHHQICGRALKWAHPQFWCRLAIEHCCHKCFRLLGTWRLPRAIRRPFCLNPKPLRLSVSKSRTASSKSSFRPGNPQCVRSADKKRNRGTAVIPADLLTCPGKAVPFSFGSAFTSGGVQSKTAHAKCSVSEFRVWPRSMADEPNGWRP